MFDYEELLRRFTVPLFVVSVVSMVITLLIGTGPEGSSNRCWIEIPGFISIQTSEFVKILFVMTFAKHIDLLKEKINKPLSVLALCIHGGLITLCVLATGDLGSALVFAAIMAIMLYTGGLSLWYFAGAIVLLLILFPYLWPKLALYQQQRILVGFDPTLDPEGYGYQPLRSLATIAAGGFRGSGYSGGSYYTTVPKYYTDFIFAVIAEKFGFFGVLAYLILMTVLIVRLIVLARRARKDCGANLCMGIAAIFIAQSLENIGMCLGMLPVIGITLPFLSYGGSSMLSSFLCVGVVLSVATHNQKYYFEREKA
jgi:rod shape determining protein RodA